MALHVVVFARLAQAEGFEALPFAILGIIAIETGLLTPPLGLLAATIPSALSAEGTVGEIFAGSVLYWVGLLVVIVSLAVFPQIATFLPNAAR